MFGISDEDSPVFVQLSANGLIRNLALPPHEERALVVGSTAGAAFQLSGPGVAPVQFHIERAKGGVWVIPAYRIEDLRLNSAAVLGPTLLEGHDILEFAGVRLEVTIRDAGAFVASGDRLHDDHRELGASYSMDLPGEADTTLLSMDPVADSTASDAQWPIDEGQRLRHHAAEDGGHVTMLQWSLDAPLDSGNTALSHPRHASQKSDGKAADFTLHGTQIIPPYRPPPHSIAAISEPPLSATRGFEPNFRRQAPGDVDTVQLVTRCNAAAPRSIPPSRMTGKPPKPRRTGVPSTRDASVAPPPLGRHPLALLAEEEEPSLHWHRACKDPQTATKVSFLTRIGLLTKARPLLVSCISGVGAALLAILLLAANRFIAPRPTHIAAPQLSAIIADLNSLQPAPTAPATVPVASPASSVATDARQADVAVQPSVAVPAVRPGVRKSSAASPRMKSLY